MKVHVCVSVSVCPPWCPLLETRLRPRCCPLGCWSGAPCRPAGRPGARGTGRCCCSPSRCCPVLPRNQGPTITWSTRLGLLHSKPPASLQPSHLQVRVCVAKKTERPSVFQPARRLLLLFPFLLPGVKLDQDAGR